jgi:cell wall-associated NlpC family hydrolase
MTALVAAARAYLHVPFRHRGRSRRGLDCAGLLVLACRDIGKPIPDQRHYGREPFNDGLVEAGTRAFGQPIAVGQVPAEFLRAGDVLLLRFDINPHHVAIVADHPLGGLSIIHANADATQRGLVVEQRLDALWLSRITHVFRTT